MTSPDERHGVVFLDLRIFSGMIPLLRLKTTDEDEVHTWRKKLQNSNNKKTNKNKTKNQDGDILQKTVVYTCRTLNG